MDVLSGRKNHKVFTVNSLNIFQSKWQWREERTKNYVIHASSWGYIWEGGWEWVRDFSFYDQNLLQGPRVHRNMELH